MNGDRLGFTSEKIKEILKTEFLLPEEILEKNGMEQAEAALEVFDSIDEFLERTGWGRDNPEYILEEYLTRNRICRWINGKLFYFSRIVWENMESGNEGEMHI